VIVDTGALLAYFDAGEPDHDAVSRVIDEAEELLVVSPYVIAELDYLVATRVGVDAELAALRELSSGAWELATFVAADLERATSIIKKYRDQHIGVADASNVVLADRYHTQTIVTLDRRHFTVLRPIRGGRFAVVPSTIYVYVGSARPFLKDWATRYDHLREVTRSDIVAGLGPLRGSVRANATKALRSLFRLAKKRGLIFTNPTIGLKARPVDFVLLPMSDMEIDAVEQLAAAPAERVIIALAAENAARTGTIRHLTLDEVDLANRRIILDGRRQRLGDLSYRALRLWLDHRRVTWPHTSNPHVLVSEKTVHGASPVSQRFVVLRMSRAGCSVDRIRKDRILHEALTAGPDPLHLSLVFGVSHNTAARYATVAEHLLSDELEQSPEQ
jgi:predicted nucleic acid-binding protein